MRNQLGIDLGSANLRVSSSGEGIVLREPAVVAVSKETGRILAVGNSAEQKLNIRDLNVVGARPFGEGIAANPDVTHEVMAACLFGAGYNQMLGCDLILSVPCDFTDSQESVLRAVAEELGIKNCYFMYTPLAAMLGAYPTLPRAYLAVDIGATKTNLMLICRGRIFYMKSIDDAGEKFDRAIVDYIWRKRKVRISLRAAEEIKMSIGTVWAGREPRSVDVTGRDSQNRSVTVRVSSGEMYEALETPMSNILEAICVAVSKVPVHSVKEVFDLGICLSGGGACLDGIEKMISGVTGVAAHRLDDPMTVTARGLAQTFEVMPVDIPKNIHNVSELIMKRVLASK